MLQAYSQLELETEAYWRQVEEDAATAATFVADLKKWKQSMPRFVSPGTGELCFFETTEAAVDAAIASQMDDTKAMLAEEARGSSVRLSCYFGHSLLDLWF